MHILKKSLFLFSLILLFGQSAFALNENAIGQYMTVINKPKPEQVNLLRQTIQVRFPQNVQTIGDACHYLLKISGYSLIDNKYQSDALKTTLTKPLPLIDRDFGPMRLKVALTTLAGSAFYLDSDPINRTVNFKLKGNNHHE
jgi:conjugative transfer region protein (TIGR03748 family)